MKNIKLLLLLLIIILAACTMPDDQISYDVTADTTPANERIVVYLPNYRFDTANIDLDKITHICLAFVNPDAGGNFVFSGVAKSNVLALVDAARNKNVKVLMSIAGGGETAVYDSLLAEANVLSTVNKLVDFLVEYRLDGIDVDLEGDRIESESYNRFISLLHAALPDDDMLLTAAVQTFTGDRISDTSLAYMDFINTMAYDATGPWRPNDPGPHSTYQLAQQHLEYWVMTRGLSASKVCLGVPFYGYDFSLPVDEMARTYAQIIADHPTSWDDDQVGQMFYNGAATIAQKTTLAKNYGGIMVWELGQDAEAPRSLLDVIYNTMHP